MNRRHLLIAAAAIFCLLCAVAAGCVSPNAVDPLPTPTPSATPAGEWEGVLANADGTQTEYKLDCEKGGSAKLEIDTTGPKGSDHTYRGTWIENVKDSYTLSFGANTYLFVINSDGTGQLTTPDGITVTMRPDDGNSAAYDPVSGDWKGTAVKGDTRTEYDLTLDRTGSAEIDVDTSSPLSYEKEMSYYGTWTKTSESVYTISVVGAGDYTLTLSSNNAGVLSTPDNGEVKVVRDY
ncbi:hypothetical protein [Methanorbis rubei]|uniref:Uncharacterized protein n=1 Tax=Methanorbis rubei TaxID=3028300 RepID=A0AAE4MFS1_9EURY|nr:hypothetical protein [Methanocorpusculaceae archaeon Cs1]